MNRSSSFPPILCFACVCVSALPAQTCTQTGTLSGLVLDPTGALIDGASIQISNGAQAHNVSSGRDGRWTVNCLPPGVYKVTVDSPGFQHSEQRAMRLSSDATSFITTKLSLEGVTDDISVGSTDDNSQTGGSNVISEKQLEGFAEDPDDFKRQLQALAAASGAIPGSAIITVDGFQSASTLPPKSSIREVRISPDMFSSEYQYPPYAGGRIEVFTKPGQNKVHGAVFGVLGSRIWNANDPFSTTGTPADKNRIGFELSGPLRRGSRADFALDLDHRNIDENVVVNAFVLSKDGSPARLNETVPTPQRLWLGSARTGWQIGSKDTLTVSFAANRNSLANKGAGGLVLREAGTRSTVSEYALRAVNTTFLSKNFLHSTRVAHLWKLAEQIPNTLGPQISAAGSFTGGGSTIGNLHKTEHDLEIDDEAYVSLKQHTIKTGVQALGAFIQNDDPDTFNGAYLFGGGSAPALGAPGKNITITGLEQYRRTLAGLPGGRPTTYTQNSGSIRVPLEQWTVAIYAQDDWKVTGRLSLSGGIRYFAQTTPAELSAVAPRIGFAYSFGGKQKWVIHARTGLFYAPITTTTSLETVRLDGRRQRSFTIYSPDFQDPLNKPAGTDPIERQRRFAPHIGIAPSSQSQLGLEHSFFKSWSVNANVYYTASWSVLRSANVNAPQLLDPVKSPAANPRPLSPNLNLFEYNQTGRFSGPFAFIGLNHFTRSFSLISGYLFNGFHSNAESADTFPQSTYQKTRDWARPTGASSHSVFAVVIYTLPLKIGSTTNLSLASGVPYDVTTGFDNNGDGVFNDRPSIVSSETGSAYRTRFGYLSTEQANGNLSRNVGRMPTTVYLDLALNRTFTLKERFGKASHQQSLRFDARSSNILNHANYTAIDGVVGTPQFGQPVSADFGRRIEFGVRLSF